ncbi:MAG: DUF890 domain-containing protein [Methanobacteriota archaeon]|nr:MAG: DUF890 domain-containing protein [Euryarchaeota archaeon]
MIVDSSQNCLRIAEAAEIWTPLRQFIADGKIDLGNPLALTEYNRALLFGLTGCRIEIPREYLIPAVCLRYSYIQFLKDQFPHSKTLLDVGTGTSAILALIAHHLGFRVFATELDPVALEWARKNLESNGVRTIVFPSSGGILKGVVPPDALDEIDLTVTYPPFYPMDTPGRTSFKKRGFKGSSSELFGGVTGIEFTRQYISEACEFQIPVPSVLLHKKEFARQTERFYSSSYSVHTVPVKAGTRYRFIVYGVLKA